MAQLSLAADFAEIRGQKRKEFAKGINPQVLVEKIWGATMKGRNEKGEEVATKVPSALGLKLLSPAPHSLLIDFSIYRDDNRLLSALPENEANRLVKSGAHTRKEVGYITDIYHAVRLFKHIKEGYRNELAGTTSILEMEKFNEITASVLKWGSQNKEVEELVGRIDALLQLLKRKSASSKVLSLKKIEKARDLLLEMQLESNPFLCTNKLGAASAALVGARNRFDEWRIKEILRRGSMAHLKEAALRTKRDVLLREVLQGWISAMEKGNPFAIHRLYQADMAKIALIGQIGANNISQTIVELEKSKSTWGSGFLKSAKELFLQGKNEDAQDEMRKLYFYLSANKPQYVFEQMQKTNDAYLNIGGDKSSLSYLESGAGLFGKKIFGRAKYCFEMALEKLG